MADIGQAVADRRQGDPRNAIAGLLADLDRAPDDDAVRFALAAALLRAGDPARALPHLRRLVVVSAAKPAYWNGLIQAMLRTGDIAGAERELGRLRRLGAGGPAFEALARQIPDAVSNLTVIRGEGGMVVTAGLPPGCSQPAIVARAFIHCPARLDLAALAQRLDELLEFDPTWPEPDGMAAADRHLALAQWVARLAVALQRSAGLPVFDEGMALWRPGDPTHTLIVPHGDPGAGQMALAWVLSMLPKLLRAGPAAADWVPFLPTLREAAEKLLGRLKRFASPTGNSVNFLRAAHRLGVPLRRIGGHAYQVGHGIHGRWLDSSFTDRTSVIGSGLAQDKFNTAAVLRRAGLPVPDHAGAVSIGGAIAIAERLGYPVVVKPVDKDGGVGVAAGLEDEAALRKAFAAAREQSERVLVEKHVDGDDFRLVVMGGRVTWAIERVPGGVTGDGERTLGALLAEVNADPRRGAGKRASLQRVEWDEEARHLAQRQGLAAGSVPAAGRFVKLRRITNVARGGMPVPFPLERIHPDNLRLAERAAAALRLDVAGIDFITPDIGRPWHQAGGAINEVNARPSLGLITAGHLFTEIVQWLLEGGDGRVPIVAVTGGTPGQATAVAERVHASLCAGGTRTGLATRRGAWVGAEQLSWVDMAGEPGGALLLTDPKAEAAVIELPADRLAGQGVPFDRCDIVVHLGPVAGVGIDGRHEAGLLCRATGAIVGPIEVFADRPGDGVARIAVSMGRPVVAPEGGMVSVWPEGASVVVGAPAGEIRAGFGRSPTLVDLYAHAAIHGLAVAPPGQGDGR